MLAAELAVATAAPAQPFHLGRWEGALEGVVDYSTQKTTTGGRRQSSLDSLRTEERLTISNRGGYILDPRLVRISATGTFGLSQESFTTETFQASRRGTLSGYDTFASLLPGQPLSLNIFASRQESFLPAQIVGTSKAITENRGATLFARRAYVPSALTFRQQNLEQESRVGDVVARRENRENIFTYDGQRGWVNSEMSLHYELVDDTDKVFPRLSYRSHDASFAYSLDFGPDLERRWDSRIRYFARQGVTEVTNLDTITVDELLRIDHSQNLRTEYRYSLIRTAVPSGTTTTHTPAFNLRHQLYKSLTTQLGLDAVLETLPEGHRNTYRSRLNFAYTKRLPANGRLNASLGGGLEYEDDQFRAAHGFIPQETHAVATPFAQPIALAEPFVIAASVVVTKIATGPLPPGCIAPPGPPTPLARGRDYRLRTVGNVTEIVPVPCSGAVPGINPGDTIAVDYRFEVPAALTFRTALWHATLSLDYHWIRPYVAHQQTDETLLSGIDGRFLDSQRSDTVGIELRRSGRRLHASMVAELQRFTSHRVSFKGGRVAEFLGLSVSRRLTLSANAEQARFTFTKPARRTRTLTQSATLTYAVGYGLLAEATGQLQLLTDSLVPNERIGAAELRLRWRLRSLEIDPTVEFFDRRRGSTLTREKRAMLYAIRRF